MTSNSGIIFSINLQTARATRRESSLYRWDSPSTATRQYVTDTIAHRFAQDRDAATTARRDGTSTSGCRIYKKALSAEGEDSLRPVEHAAAG